MDAPLTITDPAFWHLPLAERMALFAELRETGPFVPRPHGEPDDRGARTTSSP